AGGEGGEVMAGPVDRADGEVVGDGVAEGGLRGRVERGHPHRVDPEPSEVLESGRQPGEVTDPIAVRVGEGPDVDLVPDGVLPPGHRLCHRIIGWRLGALSGHPALDRLRAATYIPGGFPCLE